MARQEEHSSQNTGTFTPVEGADVEIKDTGLHSTTNSKGQFTISQIPSQITVTYLIISRGGQSHTVETMSAMFTKSEPELIDYRLEQILSAKISFCLGSKGTLVNS